MILLGLLLGCAEPAPEPDATDPFVAECPWAAGEGVGLGQIATDLTFDACDGGQVSIHDQCGARVTMVVFAFGWCLPCIDHIGLAGELQETWPDLNVVVALAEDALGDPATEGFCTDFADHVGAGDVWLLDPTQQMGLYGGPGDVLILDADGVIRFNRDDATDGAIADAVEAAVAASG